MFLKWPAENARKRSPRLRNKSFIPSPPALNQNSRWLPKNPGNVYLVKHREQEEGRRIDNSSVFLPVGAMEEILSRLPVKSLMRFTCVCKSWYHLIIYSQRFVSLHLNNFKTSHLLVGTLGESCSKGLATFLPTPPPLALAHAGAGGDNDNDASPQKFVELRQPLLAGSCNGVICLYNQSPGCITLWNPATKKMNLLPDSNIPRKMDEIIASCAVGFGFDPKTNDYKVLQMVYDEDTTLRVIQLELYSLRKNSWRKVDSLHDFFFNRQYWGWERDLVCNLPFTDYRYTCALVMGINRPTNWEIFLFDMSTEIIDTIPIPSSIEAQLGDNRCDSKLFPFKESLTIGISHRCIGGQALFDIWVLNDFNTRESRSWTNIFSMEHGLGTIPKMIGGWENYILYQNTLSRKLGCFDLVYHDFTETLTWPQPGIFCLTTSIFRESLVRVDEMKEIRVGKRSCNELHQEGKRSQEYNDVNQDIQPTTQTRDPLIVRDGPMTRSRKKKLKDSYESYALMIRRVYEKEKEMNALCVTRYNWAFN